MTLPAPHTTHVPASDAVAPARPTAIVVDDSITARTLLKAALSQAGFDVVAEAERGDQVLALYEKYRPSLLTLDIVMPILDGVAAAEKLFGKYPEATVVMCSSLSAKDKIMACRDLGVKHFILKPMVPENVIRIVRGVMEEVQPPDQVSEAAS